MMDFTVDVSLPLPEDGNITFPRHYFVIIFSELNPVIPNVRSYHQNLSDFAGSLVLQQFSVSEEGPCIQIICS
jgi:hypothetical protein